jgi:glycosyltransferase involved in cell wall biosynthesis
MITVTIVLPSYNRAHYIGLTIESCLAQTYKEFELIIVDDGSKDNSIEVIESYTAKDSRIKLIKNPVNKKLPGTLNNGFKNANGKYYTWISDDNLFAPNALEKMVKILDNHSDIGLVYADYISINDDGKTLARIYQEPPEYLPIRDCVGACFLYRASVAEQIGGYNEQMFLIEDYEYWLRLGLVTKLYHIAEPLYFYRVHATSLTKTRALEINHAKKLLKSIYLGKFSIPEKLKPINNLYLWFIEERTLISYIKLIRIILANPITTLSYIFKNLRRL